MRARISRRTGVPRRALLVALIAVFFIPSTAHAFLGTDTCAFGAAGSTKETATELVGVAVQTCSGDTSPSPGFGFVAQPDDWYKWSFTAPTSLGLRVQTGFLGALADRFSFMGPKGLIAPTSPTTTGPEWHLRLPAGVYHLQIKGLVGFGDYTFAYNFLQQSDCGTPGLGFSDAGDNAASAMQLFIESGLPCYGTIWGSSASSNPFKADPQDWFKFTLNQGQSVTAQITGYADYSDGCGPSGPELLQINCSADITGLTAPTVDLLDDKGAPVGSPPQSNAGTSTTPISYTSTRAGTPTYFLRVTATQDDVYVLTVTSAAVPNTNTILGNDQCSSPDVSNTEKDAVELFPSDFVPAACYGFLGVNEADKDDWYKFNVQASDLAPKLLSFEFGADTLFGAYEIKDPTGAVIGSGFSSLIPATTGPLNLTKTGYYKLRIYQSTPSNGRYEFALDVRTGVGALPGIPPSLPPIGVDALTNDSCAKPGTTDAGNNGKSTAPIYTGQYYCLGSLNKTANDGEDWYSFEANKGQKFSFMLSGDGLLDPNLYLYKGDTLYRSYTSGLGIPDVDVLTDLDTKSTWKVKIVPAFQGQAGNYLFMFDWRDSVLDGIPPSNLPTTIPSVVPSIPSISVNVLTDDCFGSGDAGNTRATARAISNQSACTGTLATTAPGDVYDWYSFPGTAGQSVAIGVSGDGNLDPNLTLFKPNGQRVTNFANKNPVPDYLRHDMTQTGKYMLAITRSNPAAGQYELMVYVATVSGVPFVPSSVPAAPSLAGDCGHGGDAPNRTQRDVRKQPAQDYNPNNACTGSLGGNDREDWYQFGGTSGQKLNLSISSNYSLDADVWLIDPRGIWRLKSANGGLTPELINDYIIDRTGTWKIRVAYASGSGDYLMSSSLANY